MVIFHSYVSLPEGKPLWFRLLVPFWTIPDVSLFELFMVSWSPIFLDRHESTWTQTWTNMIIWRGTSFSEACLRQISCRSTPKGIQGRAQRIIRKIPSVIKHGWEIPELTKVFMGQFPILSMVDVPSTYLISRW